MEILGSIVDSLKVEITETELPPGWWGAYDHDRNRILLIPGLGPVQYRSTLAHELGHAWYGHLGVSARQERKAAVWAARILIREDALVEALRVAECREGVAQILRVMPDDVDVFVSALSPAERRRVARLIPREEAC